MTNQELFDTLKSPTIKEGWDAFLNGDDYWDCPYTEYAHQRKWHYGYTLAQERN